MRFIAVLTLVLATASLAACATQPTGSQSSRSGPTVVVTTTQLGDLARAVAGDRGAVEQILEPGTDPHAYEPRPSDLRAVADAKLVVRSGGDVDSWLGDVLRGAGSDADAITILDELRPRTGDPHWWQNPRNAVIAVQRIRDALIAADPRGRDAYATGAERYVTRLLALDDAIAACMRRVPRADRKLVTDHDALGAYADRYDIEVIGTVIPALSTQAQASGGEVSRLVRTIRSAGVSTIFPESSINQKLTRAIARDAGAKVGAALYADSLGPRGSPGATYLSSLRANTRALVDGFTDGSQDCALPR
jgi:ABC-type Zn uptake system ZnuABC Zn-binding protein ZnuA